jgi:hypothetical protein
MTLLYLAERDASCRANIEHLVAHSPDPDMTVTRDAGSFMLGALDVHFISSLPVIPGTAYKAWVDSKPVQMVWGVD